jgi:2-polyprenyl-3-methyl-5-hydroxy-6-metoxy-1,4-benzoquinol methylase
MIRSFLFIDSIRHSWVWQKLRRVGFLRSLLYFGIEIRRQFREAKNLNPNAIDREFRLKLDPFNYAGSPIEHVRFQRQLEMLDSVRGGRVFERVLEIGCAEGMFTEMIADRSESLLAVDISATALLRARHRRDWTSRVRFQQWDLVCNSIPGCFDLIVATGVLEYQLRLKIFKMIRAKLVAALCPGGHLLLQSTKTNQVVENACWGKYFIRGERINRFIAEHKQLKVINKLVTETYAITLFKKTYGAEALRATEQPVWEGSDIN